MTRYAAARLSPASHPCFFAGARHSHGRIHLPVAAGCNIRCGYCDHRTDCPHESRPGLASRVMTPEQALEWLSRTRREMPWLAVAGIAGPGDPFHDPDNTLATLELVRAHHQDLLLCLSSNGLGMFEYIPRLAELGVGFVTLTVNAVDPAVGTKLYSWISWQGRRLEGAEAADLLWERQEAALVLLKVHGLTVKVNMVVVPGINDLHVTAVARRVAALGADLMNLIPLIPLPGTPLAGTPLPSAALMESLRRQAGRYLPQMRHCQRCRADAAGFLGE